ncbi:MAG: hypothetical protein JSS27_01040 [Planctomycetes bacterium]|nr:hypothetical protein [Planctomycetota bacterium]
MASKVGVAAAAAVVLAAVMLVVGLTIGSGARFGRCDCCGCCSAFGVYWPVEHHRPHPRVPDRPAPNPFAEAGQP